MNENTVVGFVFFLTFLISKSWLNCDCAFESVEMLVAIYVLQRLSSLASTCILYSLLSCYTVGSALMSFPPNYRKKVVV